MYHVRHFLNKNTRPITCIALPLSGPEYWMKVDCHPTLINYWDNEEQQDDSCRTTHLSKDAARAPELETSNVNPFRFCKISWSFSKFVRGGGKCRLVIREKFKSTEFREVRKKISHLRTAVCGNVSWIFFATLIFASNMNSSTRLLVSFISFCSTSIGSDDSELSRWILTSGEARLSAPAAILPALSFWASVFRRRTPMVNSSCKFLTKIDVRTDHLRAYVRILTCRLYVSEPPHR